MEGYFISEKKINYNKRLLQKRMLSYPRVDNDLLMLAASFKRSPSAPELFCLSKTARMVKSHLKKYESDLKEVPFFVNIANLSDPARSTKFSLPNLMFVIESASHCQEK